MSLGTAAWSSPVYQKTVLIVLSIIFISGLIVFFFRQKNYYFDASWASRRRFEQLEIYCLGIMEMCSDPRILHDFYLRKSALADYDYSKYKAIRSTGGSFTSKVESLKQFFPNLSGRKGKMTDEQK